MTPKPTPDPMAVALKLLAGRDKSERTLRADLAKRGIEPEAIDATIAALIKRKYLDDERSAESRARVGLKAGKSPAQLAIALERAGFTAHAARQGLDAATREVGYEPRAHALRLLAVSKKTGPAAARFLASRGIDEDLIRSLVSLPDSEP